MMHVLVILLAVIGLATLVLLAVGALSDKTPTPPPPADDPAAPYREGLHAAIRMQRVAQDLEHQLYTEAAQHLGVEGESSGTQVREEQP